MTKVNWQRSNERSRIARTGSECISDDGLPGGLTPPRKRQSKAAIQAEIDAAKAQITRTVTCPCGHAGKVLMPASKRLARLRCSKCGQEARG